jgi:hypothetical protein
MEDLNLYPHLAVMRWNLPPFPARARSEKANKRKVLSKIQSHHIISKNDKFQ